MADITQTSLEVLQPERALTPSVFGQEEKIPSMVYGNFVSVYEFVGTLQSSLVAGQAVGILSLNPQLTARVIRQFYPTGYLLNLGCTPADPLINWQVWSDDFLDFLAQTQEIIPTMGGLASLFMKFHIETDEASFKAKKLKIYGIDGNTTMNNPKPLSSQITDMSYNKNIVTFMSPVGMTNNAAIAIEADVAPAVGTAETVTVTVQVGRMQ